MKNLPLLFSLVLILNSCFFDIKDHIDDLQPLANINNWELIWEDNFADSINYNDWSKIPRTRTDLGWQRYMSDVDSCYEINNGILKLKGIKNSVLLNDTASYLTGGIWTKGKRSIALGKIEVKAKVNKVHGTWPAIWMLDEKRKNPDYMGEIDIFESINAENIIHQTIHTNYSLANNFAFKSANTIDDKEKFNIYGVIINPSEIIFLTNNKITYIYKKNDTMERQDQFPFGDGHDMYLILSMQLNNIDWTGHVIDSQLPSEMQIDWVRFYKKIDDSIPDY